MVLMNKQLHPIQICDSGGGCYFVTHIPWTAENMQIQFQFINI